jgi:hypothetical protein
MLDPVITTISEMESTAKDYLLGRYTYTEFLILLTELNETLAIHLSDRNQGFLIQFNYKFLAQLNRVKIHFKLNKCTTFLSIYYSCSTFLTPEDLIKVLYFLTFSKLVFNSMDDEKKVWYTYVS